MGSIAEALKRAERRTTAEASTAGVAGGIASPSHFGTSVGPAYPRQVDVQFEPNVGRATIAPVDDIAASGAVAWDVHPTVVAICDRASPIAEQYRSARTWILRRRGAARRQCIAITSSVGGEGKTVTAANLSAVFAEIRHLNVLAVDCDFRQGALSRLFKLNNAPGLSDVLAGRAGLAEAYKPTPVGNLCLLPAGTCIDVTPAELLNSSAAARAFEEIRDRFDVVLVDSPPIQPLSDVGAIGAFCTGIVVVVRMNRTPSHVVRQSLHWLSSNNLSVLGCIAADCSAKGMRYEYEDDDDD